MSERPRILLVCYYFPPLGGGGVGRPLALFRDLPDHGIGCDVLTVKPVAYRAYDYSLLDGLDVRRIHRSGSRDPQRLMRLFGFKRVRIAIADRAQRASSRFFPDNKIGWTRPAVRLGRTLIANRHYNAILSTSPPISAHLVAEQLSKDYHLPWIADFRDFWSSYRPEALYDDTRQQEKARQMLERFGKSAASIVAVNRPIAEYLQTKTVIPNCYDKSTESLWRVSPQTDCFRIGLFGTFNDRLPLAPLLEVLADVRRKAPRVFAAIKLVQVGPVDEYWVEEELARFQMGHICESHGFLPRNEAITTMASCAAFYIGLQSEREKALGTGRVYYLIASGRPILAFAPLDGELYRLLRDYGQAHLFSPNSVESASAYLETLVADWGEGKQTARIGSEFARQFSSTRMVESFAGVIRGVI